MSSYRIEVLIEAEADLELGRHFYESQEQGIGDYFWDTVLSDIESLLIYAGIHQQEEGLYRMPSKRFPYSIYYDVVDETVFVIAVLPERRNPDWIQKRLGLHS